MECSSKKLPGGAIIFSAILVYVIEKSLRPSKEISAFLLSFLPKK
jgi:hypothetical protein